MTAFQFLFFIFFSLIFSNCVIATDFNFSGELNYNNAALFHLGGYSMHLVRDDKACFASDPLVIILLYFSENNI